MKILYTLLLSSYFALPANAATTNYSAALSDSACVSAKSCVVTFPAVATGKTLTISHVSCGVLTSGESAFLTNAVLSTVKSGSQGDHLLIEVSVSGSNGEGTISQATTFYVNAADAATITLTSGANIAASSDGGCYISGFIK